MLFRSIDLIDKLEEDLEKGVRKVEEWADSVGVNIIEMEFNKKDPFFNINTRADDKPKTETKQEKVKEEKKDTKKATKDQSPIWMLYYGIVNRIK